MPPTKKLKLISWNVNGINACNTPRQDREDSAKTMPTFSEILRQEDADIFAINEAKLSTQKYGKLDFSPYHIYHNEAKKSGYSGVAILTKIKPLAVFYNLETKDGSEIKFDLKNEDLVSALLHEGRILTLEFKDFFLINVYVPNSKDELKRLHTRGLFDDALKRLAASFMQEFNGVKKHVLMCGDFNVANEDIDLNSPATNHHHAGFTDEERASFKELLSIGMVDTFRATYPKLADAYSWWGYRYTTSKRLREEFNARINSGELSKTARLTARYANKGWRIDYFLASLNARYFDAKIYADIKGSDHCPVGIMLEVEE